MEGSIEVFGQDIVGAPPDEEIGVRSRWGVLFQGGALFSTLTVAENVEVPLKQFYPGTGCGADARDRALQGGVKRPAPGSDQQVSFGTCPAG